MSHIISSLCIGEKDGSCIEVCPVDCMNYTTTKDRCVSGDISSFFLNTSTLVPVETGLI